MWLLLDGEVVHFSRRKSSVTSFFSSIFESWSLASKPRKVAISFLIWLHLLAGTQSAVGRLDDRLTWICYFLQNGRFAREQQCEHHVQ
jgi:hypothetical protein